MTTGKRCKHCGQPTKRGRHKPGEYQHARGCQSVAARRQREERARKAGATVTEKKSEAARENLNKGRRPMDPEISRIMAEYGVSRQRAHQIDREGPGPRTKTVKQREAETAAAMQREANHLARVIQGIGYPDPVYDTRRKKEGGVE